MKPKIAVVIIHYNTPEFLRTCIDSILTQTYKNIEVIFIDNNSPDRSGIDFVKKRYGGRENLKIVPNSDNLGYAKAANQGIRMAIEVPNNKADYVVITNPDIIYHEKYFEKIIERIEKNPKIAAITGKVYKYDFDRDKPTNIIDTVGLFAYKNRRIIDDGQGLIDEGQFDQEKEIFGISGACPLYRREALEDVKVFDEYLDEDFFMYKEDVDLSWRFLICGWKNLYYPGAIAYHGRGTGIHRRFFNKEILENRSKLSKFQRFHSFRNQHFMQLKNEFWINRLIDLPYLAFRKAGIMAYITFKEPFLWRAYFEYLSKFFKTLKKRKELMKKRKISAKEMRGYFQKQTGYLK